MTLQKMENAFGRQIRNEVRGLQHGAGSLLRRLQIVLCFVPGGKPPAVE